MPFLLSSASSLSPDKLSIDSWRPPMSLSYAHLPLPRHVNSSRFIYNEEQTFTIEWVRKGWGAGYRACFIDGKEILRAESGIKNWTGQSKLPVFFAPDSPDMPLFTLKSSWSSTKKPFYLETPDGSPFMSFRPRTLVLKERFDVKYAGVWPQIGEKTAATVVEDVTLEARSQNNQSSEFLFTCNKTPVARMLRFLPGSEGTKQAYPDFKVTVAPGVDVATIFAAVVTFDISKDVA